MKLHMIGGPYAGCLYDPEAHPLSAVGALPKELRLPALGGGPSPTIYRLEIFHCKGEESLPVMIHEGSSCREAMLDMLATHRQVSLEQGPARTLLGQFPSRFPKNVS